MSANRLILFASNTLQKALIRTNPRALFRTLLILATYLAKSVPTFAGESATVARH
jgi:hypothetical protein